MIAATGKTYLAAQKWALSLYRSTGILYRVELGNNLLKIADKHGEDVDGFLYELGLNRHTPIFLATDSGTETYEMNILKAYLPFVTEEPFGAAGSDDNQLRDSFGPARAFTTFNNGSKTQDGLPAYVNMVQTLEELSLFMSENITARFSTGSADWQQAPFFRTPFTHQQVAEILKPANDHFVTTTPQRLLGYTARGDRLETTPGSNESANLRAEGHRRYERQIEPARMWVVPKTYVALTIVGGLVGLGPICLTLLPHLVHAPGLALLIFARTADTLIYWSLGLAALLAKRWIFLRLRWSDTKVWDGFSLPTFLYVSPYPWVHEALVDIARAAQGLAYTTTKSYFDSIVSNRANDDHRATANRNTIAIVLRPGHTHQAEKFDNEEATQIGRHLLTQMSLPLPEWLTWLAWLFPAIRPTPPKVIAAGTANPVLPKDTWGQMAHTTEALVAPSKLLVIPGTNAEDVPYHVAEYYLEQYESFTWFLQESRVIVTQLHKMAQGVLRVLFRYPEGRFFGGGAVKSTQASAPGADILEVAEKLAKTVPMRMVPIGIPEAPPQYHNPVNIVESAIWKSWSVAAHWIPIATTQREKIIQPAPRLLTGPAHVKVRGRKGKKLGDLPASPPTAPPPTTPVAAPVSSPGPTNTSTPAGRALRALKKGTGSGGATSLITTGAPNNQEPEILWEVPVTNKGTLGKLPKGIPDAVKSGLKLIVNSFAPLSGPCVIAVMRGLDRTASFQFDTDNSPPVGVFFFHEHLVMDAGNGVKGAQVIAKLEMAEEREHFEQGAAVQSLAYQRKAEVDAILVKLATFLHMEKSDQDDGIGYLDSTENQFDQAHRFSLIYRHAQNEFFDPKYAGLEKIEAIDKTLEVLKSAVIYFVDRVFASEGRLAEPNAALPDPVEPNWRPFTPSANALLFNADEESPANWKRWMPSILTGLAWSTGIFGLLAIVASVTLWIFQSVSFSTLPASFQEAMGVGFLVISILGILVVRNYRQVSKLRQAA
jgi:hypothetical protein